jgi:hypothetical protein
MQMAATPEYIRSVANPAVLGITLGVLTFAGYVLFFIISLCCKCCSKSRGCCQRAKAVSYMHRLPFILLVCLGALLAIIGGAVVLRAAPGFTLSLNQLIVDMITKVCAPYVSLKRLSSWF